MSTIVCGDWTNQCLIASVCMLRSIKFFSIADFGQYLDLIELV